MRAKVQPITRKERCGPILRVISISELKKMMNKASGRDHMKATKTLCGGSEREAFVRKSRFATHLDRVLLIAPFSEILNRYEFEHYPQNAHEKYHTLTKWP